MIGKPGGGGPWGWRTVTIGAVLQAPALQQQMRVARHADRGPTHTCFIEIFKFLTLFFDVNFSSMIYGILHFPADRKPICLTIWQSFENIVTI